MKISDIYWKKKVAFVSHVVDGVIVCWCIDDRTALDSPKERKMNTFCGFTMDLLI